MSPHQRPQLPLHRPIFRLCDKSVERLMSVQYQPRGKGIEMERFDECSFVGGLTRQLPNIPFHMCS
jgi:hypothetical protein